MLKSVVYISSSSGAMSKKTLLEILEKSSKNNKRLHITGMLIYHDGSFIQVLEGDEMAVNSILRKISIDPRHRNITIVHESYNEQREFGAWEMSFSLLENDDLEDIENFVNLNSLELNEDERSGDAIAILRTFYEMNVNKNTQFRF